MRAIFMLLLLFVASNGFAKMHQEDLNFQLGDVKFKSSIYYDDAFEGKRPGVLVFGERWGLNDFSKLRAEMLAESGYTALAVDIYGDAQSTRKVELAEKWEKRAAMVLEEFQKHKKVDQNKIAAIGYSMGGNTAMKMALLGSNVAGIVIVHSDLLPITVDQANNINSKLLFLQGGADRLVTLDNLKRVATILTEAGVDWEIDVYGKAQQSFSNPYADSYGVENMSFDSDAETKSWSRLLYFFESLFEEELIL
jgi:dienelactone hydrolase